MVFAKRERRSRGSKSQPRRVLLWGFAVVSISDIDTVTVLVDQKEGGCAFWFHYILITKCRQTLYRIHNINGTQYTGQSTKNKILTGK